MLGVLCRACYQLYPSYTYELYYYHGNFANYQSNLIAWDYIYLFFYLVTFEDMQFQYEVHWLTDALNGRKVFLQAFIHYIRAAAKSLRAILHAEKPIITLLLEQTISKQGFLKSWIYFLTGAYELWVMFKRSLSTIPSIFRTGLSISLALKLTRFFNWLHKWLWKLLNISFRFAKFY